MALSFIPLAQSRRIAACSTRRFSSLRERRSDSSCSRSTANNFNGCRLVTNGINHSATLMFLLYRFQQNDHLDHVRKFAVCGGELLDVCLHHFVSNCQIKISEG